MTANRLVSLDFIRGAAVMGIVAANMPGFALPEAAYFSPVAWGGSTGVDRLAWATTFVLVEGKMRGLFSLLFGASMLLVIDRAGEDAATVHFTRLGWLFVFGLVHLYLLWSGDILAHYALVGTTAFAFHRLPVRWLVALGAVLVLWQVSIGAALTLDAFGAYGGTARDAYAKSFGMPSATSLAREIAAHRGSYGELLVWRLDHADTPITLLVFEGPNTMALMLLGMAGLRSGLLTGEWSIGRYRCWTAWCLATTLPAYALLAAWTARHGFDPRWIILQSFAATPALRPVTTIGYACLLILLLRPGGWLTGRVAATGRMAFSNYISTTLVATALFDGWGLGLFASMSRAGLFVVAVAIWLLMLGWSKPWLTRFSYGPLEWLWRSLARMAWQPIRARPDVA